MSESQITVGVDIGSSKVATVIGKLEEETINILGVSEIPSKGIRKGQIVDIEEAAESVNSSLDVAERMAGVSIDRVFVSVSGAYIESQNSKGVVAISQPGGEIVAHDIDRVLEAAGAISMPQNKSIIHVLPRSFTVDGESGIKDPVGMTGVRLEVETHIISANSTTVKNIQRLLEQEAGVGINSPVFAGLASSIAVLSETERELGVVLVDIGAGITSICVFVEGSLSFSSVVPIGARHITNDLAIGLRISLESAEKIKLYLSKSDKKRQIRDEGENKDEIDVSELKLSEEIRKVSAKTLIDGIIVPRLNELFTIVGIELKKSGFGTQTPAGIVITGGGARTVGAQDSCRRMLSMPVRVGVPTGISGLIDEVENPSFATAVGLLVFGRGFRVKESSGIFDALFKPFKARSSPGTLSLIKKILKYFIP